MTINKIILITLSLFSVIHLHAQKDTSNTPTETSGWGGFTLIVSTYQSNPGALSGGMGGITNGNWLMGGFGYGGRIQSNTPEAKSVDLGVGGVYLGYKASLYKNLNYVVFSRLGYGGGLVLSPTNVETEFGIFRPHLSLGLSYPVNEYFTLLLLSGYDYNISTSGTPDIAQNMNGINISLGILFGKF